MHHEAPDQQHGGHGEDRQTQRADRDNDGDQHAEVELGEVALQRLTVQLQRSDPDRGIGQLHADHDEELVTSAPTISQAATARVKVRRAYRCRSTAREGGGERPEQQ